MRTTPGAPGIRLCACVRESEAHATHTGPTLLQQARGHAQRHADPRKRLQPALPASCSASFSAAACPHTRRRAARQSKPRRTALRATAGNPWTPPRRHHRTQIGGWAWQSQARHHRRSRGLQTARDDRSNSRCCRRRRHTMRAVPPRELQREKGERKAAAGDLRRPPRRPTRPDMHREGGAGPSKWGLVVRVALSPRQTRPGALDLRRAGRAERARGARRRRCGAASPTHAPPLTAVSLSLSHSLCGTKEHQVRNPPSRAFFPVSQQHRPDS